MEKPDEKIIMTYISEFKPSSEILDDEIRTDNYQPNVSIENHLQSEHSNLQNSNSRHHKNQDDDIISIHSRYSNIPLENNNGPLYATSNLLLDKTIQHLENVHAQQLYDNENFPIYSQLEYSINNNLKNMIDSLITEDYDRHKVNELLEKYDIVNDSINLWRDRIENNLPNRIFNIVKTLKGYSLVVNKNSRANTPMEFGRNKSPTRFRHLSGQMGSTQDLSSPGAANIDLYNPDNIKELENTIKQFYVIKKTAKFNGINLPTEYWQYLQTQIKNIEDILPQIKLKSNIKIKEQNLKQKVDETDEKLKFWCSPYVNLKQVETLYADYQKTALLQSKMLKSAENEYNRAVKEYDLYEKEVAAGNNNNNITSTPNTSGFLNPNDNSLGNLSMTVRSEISSGLHMEITSTGQLLNEILKNYEVFNKNFREISTHFEENPERFIEIYSKSQYKQMKSELRSASTFLIQTLSEEGARNINNNYENLKSNKIPILDRLIQEKENKLKKDKELSKQKRLCDTLKNWINTVNKDVKNETTNNLDHLEKLKTDYGLYIKPLFIKIEDKSKVENAERCFQELKNIIKELEETMKQQEFVNSLAIELENINANDDNVDQNLTFLRLTILDALENLNQENPKIAGPVFQKAKQLEAELIAKQKGLADQDNKRKKYEEMKSALKTKTYVDENEFDRIFEEYAKTLPLHLVSSLKLENSKLLRNYRNRIKNEHIKGISSKLDKTIVLVENTLIPDYDLELRKIPRQIEHLNNIKKLLEHQPFLKEKVEYLSKTLNQMTSLSNELLDNNTDNHGLIITTKRLVKMFEDLNAENEKLRHNIENILTKVEEIEENIKNIGDFIEQCRALLEEAIDSDVGSGSESGSDSPRISHQTLSTSKEKESLDIETKIKSLQDLLQQSENYTNLIKSTATEITNLLKNFSRLKDLKYHQADILSFKFNHSENIALLKERIRKLENKKENVDLYNKLSKIDNDLFLNPNATKTPNKQNPETNPPSQLIVNYSQYIEKINTYLSDFSNISHNNSNIKLSSSNQKYSSKLIEKLNQKIVEIQNEIEREENSTNDLGRLTEMVKNIVINDSIKFENISAVRNQVDVNRDYQVSTLRFAVFVESTVTITKCL